jgi:hypothetical protein
VFVMAPEPKSRFAGDRGTRVDTPPVSAPRSPMVEGPAHSISDATEAVRARVHWTQNAGTRSESGYESRPRCDACSKVRSDQASQPKQIAGMRGVDSGRRVVRSEQSTAQTPVILTRWSLQGGQGV